MLALPTSLGFWGQAVLEKSHRQAWVGGCLVEPRWQEGGDVQLLPIHITTWPMATMSPPSTIQASFPLGHQASPGGIHLIDASWGVEGGAREAKG